MSFIRATIRNIKNPWIRSTVRSVIGWVIFHPLITTLFNPFGGDSAAATIRNSTASVNVYDDTASTIIRTAAIDEHRAEGHRRVENLFTQSENIAHADWQLLDATKVGVASGVGPNGEDAMEISFASTSGEIYQSGILTAGNDYTSKYLIATVSGSEDYRVNVGQNYTTVTLSTTFQEISATNTAANTVASIRSKGAGASANLYIIKMQVEDVTGMTNQNPSEYVANDTAKGAQFVIDSTCDDAADWTLGTDWTVSDGTLTAATPGSGIYAEPDVAGTIEQERLYFVEYTCTSLSAGQYGIVVNGGFNSLNNTGVGTFVEIITAGAGGNTGIRSNGALIASFDDLTIYEATTGRQVFTTTNANTVASNVVTEAAGNPLFPTKTVDGAVWNDTKPDWETGAWAAGSECNYQNKWYSTVAGGTDSATFGDTITWVEQGLHNNIYGLLTEPAATNGISKSEEFDAWSIISGASAAADTSVAPNGTTTADTITFTANAASAMFKGATLTAAEHTFSVFTKTASGTKQFRITCWDATAGTQNSADFTATTEWQRFDFTATLGEANMNMQIKNSTGAAAGDVIVWGAQGELGAVPTSNIPTTTAAVPRETENGTIEWAQAGNIDLTKGVMVCDVVFGYDESLLSAGNRGLVSLNGIAGMLYNTDTQLASYDGTGNTPVSSPAWLAGETIRIALRWNAALSKFQVGYLWVTTHGASWVWGADTAFDGVFTGTGGLIELVVSQFGPVTFRNLPVIYGQDMTTAQIEAKY